MQEASGVDLTDLYWSAHLPSIFDLATDRVPNSFSRLHSRSVLNFRACASGRAVVHRDGRCVSAILCDSLAQRRVALAEK